jgi:RNA polymerase sigma-70 factor (ECF subfamily)
MKCVPSILANRNARFGSPLGSDELADLVQDTLAAVWAKLGTFAGESALESWVYPFCVNFLMNAIRTKQRRPDHLVLESRPDLATQVLEVEQVYQRAELLYRHLQRLEQSQERVIRLRHFDSLSFEEIAARLVMPVSSAKALYRRGLERLRVYLAPHLQEELS